MGQSRVGRLNHEFKGLQLGDNRELSPDEALDALLLILAIRSSKIPQQLVGALPPGCVWQLSAQEVREWCKENR